MKARLILICIILAIFIAIIFNETQIWFEPQVIYFLEREIVVTDQMVIAGVSMATLTIALAFGLFERLIAAIVKVRKKDKKGLMARKK